MLQTTSKPVTPDMMKNKNKLAKKLLKSQKSAKTATASSTPDVSKPGTPLPISASFPPPTITPAEFNEILTKSESYYHPFSRQAENFSLNLTSWLTGSAVLNLKVRSIPPHILVLVGAGRQGALAMNVVRQIHGGFSEMLFCGQKTSFWAKLVIFVSKRVMLGHFRSNWGQKTSFQVIFGHSRDLFFRTTL